MFATRSLRWGSVRTAVAVGLLAASAVSVPAPPAEASATPVLWGVDWGTSMLYSIDPATGLATEVPRTAPNGPNAASIVAVALDPSSGAVVALTDDCALATVDVATGAIDLSGTSLSESGNALPGCTAFTIDGSGTGWLSYGAYNDAWLGRVDPASGTVTALPNRPPTYFDSLWFDPSSGELFGVDDNSGNVIRSDLVTGEQTDLGTTLSPFAYGVVVDDSGSYWANDWSTGVYRGASSDWQSGTLIGTGYGLPSANVSAMFTTTNYWPSASTTVTPPPGLASTGFDGSRASMGAVAAVAALVVGVLLRRCSARSMR